MVDAGTFGFHGLPTPKSQPWIPNYCQLRGGIHRRCALSPSLGRKRSTKYESLRLTRILNHIASYSLGLLVWAGSMELTQRRCPQREFVAPNTLSGLRTRGSRQTLFWKSVKRRNSRFAGSSNQSWQSNDDEIKIAKNTANEPEVKKSILTTFSDQRIKRI